MPVSTTTGMSPLQLTMNERLSISANREVLQSAVRKVRRADWESVIVKADRMISIAGAVGVICSLIYFAPFLINILVR